MLKRSILLRMVIVGGLGVTLMVPAVIIMNMIEERESRHTTAMVEVSDKWGTIQTISGPALTIPYYIDSKLGVREDYHVLPESLSIAATAVPEVRYRGLYKVVLYTTKIHITGTFVLPDVSSLHIKPDSRIWSEAALAFGIGDTRGIKDISVTWEDQIYPVEPGIASNDFLKTGVTIHPEVSPQKSLHTFSANITLQGAGDLLFLPVGKNTVATVSSSWNNPSFVGRFLPEARTVDGNGFNARWRVLHLNRNFPQHWVGGTVKPGFNLSDYAFGVRLILPVDEYQKTMRSAKYAIMFISLTFLSFFLTEILTKKTIHPIQYSLVGFGLVVFYCLLLSLSEQMSFNYAYIISSVSVIALTAGYTRSVLRGKVFALIISGVLTLLYGFLFVILQLEDYALLFGSLGLFSILAAVMYMTRNVDWFAIGKEKEDGSGELKVQL